MHAGLSSLAGSSRSLRAGLQDMPELLLLLLLAIPEPVLSPNLACEAHQVESLAAQKPFQASWRANNTFQKGFLTVADGSGRAFSGGAVQCKLREGRLCFLLSSEHAVLICIVQPGKQNHSFVSSKEVLGLQTL